MADRIEETISRKTEQRPPQGVPPLPTKVLSTAYLLFPQRKETAIP
jgi:hypothetical protein